MTAPSQTARASLIEGPVAPQLLRLSGSMLIGIASIILLNVTDTFFIGQLGAMELAAISFTIPVTMLVVGLTMGVSVGTSAIVSRAIGSGDQQQVRRLTTHCLAFALLLVVFSTVLGFLTIDPVFRLLGANDVQLGYIHQYMEIWYFGIGLVVIPMVGNSAIRATGDTRTPSRIMLLAAVINMILDPLLIFGIGPFPRLELQGAAFATLIAYAFTFVVAVWILTQRENMLMFSRNAFDNLGTHWRSLMRLALPAALTNMLNPLTAAALTHLIAYQGHHAVAAFGVGTRIESLAMIGVMAMSSVLTPFIGQNLGAKENQRVQQAISFSLRFGLYWGIAAGALLWILAEPIASLFSDEEETIRLTTLYLKILPIGYLGLALVVFGSSIFNAFQQPRQAAQLVLLRLLLLCIPLALIGSLIADTLGIFIGLCLANLIAGSRAFIVLRYQQKSLVEHSSEAG